MDKPCCPDIVHQLRAKSLGVWLTCGEQTKRLLSGGNPQDFSIILKFVKRVL